MRRNVCISRGGPPNLGAVFKYFLSQQPVSEDRSLYTKACTDREEARLTPENVGKIFRHTTWQVVTGKNNIVDDVRRGQQQLGM